jgi:hypothetical protein
MFDSLEQQMRDDENRASTGVSRMIRYGAYLLAALVVMSGLTYVVHLIG